MCVFSKPKIPPAPVAAAPVIANPGSTEAGRRADEEARLRRRRAGAAASILTGPRGIPSSDKLGQPT